MSNYSNITLVYGMELGMHVALKQTERYKHDFTKTNSKTVP